MGLKAKKPVVNKPRFKALLYSNTGVGKTHFCCSMPNTYYIDTEGVEDYSHFVQMIVDNQGDLVVLKDLTDIINEVQTLLSTTHNYKTLVIDSLSFPCGLLSNLEAERLARKAKDSEGTEFGANLAKAKRLTFHLGMLLSRLDMNVIVTSHEKTRYISGAEVGKTYDINEKMAYSLGTVINLRQQGNSKKAFIEKSRYPQLPTGEAMDFSEGFEMIKKLFGTEIFMAESKPQELATPDQIDEFERLTALQGIPEETKQKWYIKCDAHKVSEITKEMMDKLINGLRAKFVKQQTEQGDVDNV